MTDMSKYYNGASNRETWLLRDSYKFFSDETITETLKNALDNRLEEIHELGGLGLWLADWMQKYHDNFIDEIVDQLQPCIPDDERGNYVHDMLIGVIELGNARINWLEIVKNYSEQIAHAEWQHYLGKH